MPATILFCFSFQLVDSLQKAAFLSRTHGILEFGKSAIEIDRLDREKSLSSLIRAGQEVKFRRFLGRQGNTTGVVSVTPISPVYNTNGEIISVFDSHVMIRGALKGDVERDVEIMAPFWTLKGLSQNRELKNILQLCVAKKFRLPVEYCRSNPDSEWAFQAVEVTFSANLRSRIRESGSELRESRNMPGKPGDHYGGWEVIVVELGDKNENINGELRNDSLLCCISIFDRFPQNA